MVRQLPIQVSPIFQRLQFRLVLGVTITPQTNLTFTSSDDILNGTSSAMIFWDDGFDSWNTSISFNGSWVGSLSRFEF